MTNDGPWICAFGGAFRKRSSGRGLAASAGASQQMSGGPGIAATGGASLQRSDGLGLGASGGASLPKNGGDGASGPDDFDRCPRRTGLVGWGGLLVGVMAGVEEELNETDVGGDGSGGPAVAVLGASCREDGWRGDGWSPERGAGVRTGATVGEEVASGLSAVLAG